MFTLGMRVKKSKTPRSYLYTSFQTRLTGMNKETRFRERVSRLRLFSNFDSDSISDSDRREKSTVRRSGSCPSLDCRPQSGN